MTVRSNTHVEVPRWKSYSRIQQLSNHASLKSFDISPLDFENDAPINITLDKLNSLEVYTHINTTIKVTAVEEESTVSGKRKQKVTVADNTGQTFLTLWENNIGMLKVDKSYSLNNVQVKEYASKNFSLSQEMTLLYKKLRMLDRLFYPICQV